MYNFTYYATVSGDLSVPSQVAVIWYRVSVHTVYSHFSCVVLQDP